MIGKIKLWFLIVRLSSVTPWKWLSWTNSFSGCFNLWPCLFILLWHWIVTYVTKNNATLADCVYLEILHSSHPELEEAREILRKIERRELYKFLGETRPESKKEIIKVMSLAEGSEFCSHKNVLEVAEHPFISMWALFSLRVWGFFLLFAIRKIESEVFLPFLSSWSMKHIKNWGKFYLQSEECQQVEIQKLNYCRNIFRKKLFWKIQNFLKDSYSPVIVKVITSFDVHEHFKTIRNTFALNRNLCALLWE